MNDIGIKMPPNMPHLVSCERWAQCIECGETSNWVSWEKKSSLPLAYASYGRPPVYIYASPPPIYVVLLLSVLLFSIQTDFDGVFAYHFDDIGNRVCEQPGCEMVRMFFHAVYISCCIRGLLGTRFFFLHKIHFQGGWVPINQSSNQSSGRDSGYMRRVAVKQSHLNFILNIFQFRFSRSRGRGGSGCGLPVIFFPVGAISIEFDMIFIRRVLFAPRNAVFAIFFVRIALQIQVLFSPAVVGLIQYTLLNKTSIRISSRFVDCCVFFIRRNNAFSPFLRSL